MHELTVIILVCLATHRITRFVISDKLAEPVANRLREALESRWEAKTGRTSDDTWGSKLAYLLSCPWCLSLHVAIAVTAVTAVTVGVTAPVLTALAASTVTGVIEARSG